MKLPQIIASVKIDGKYFSLSEGVTKIGRLKFNVVLENKAEDLYSWVVYLENESGEKSPRIQEFSGLDITVPVKGGAKFNTLRGDDCTVYSFYPESFDIKENEVITREPLGGRSSNTTAFPYFDVVNEEGEGFVCGIGWSGQWKLEVTRKNDEINLRAGFKDCDFILEPYEKVRSIRALIAFGDGGENKLRHKFVRLHRKYYSPVPKFDNNAPVSVQCFDRYYWGNEPKDGKLSYFESEDAQLNIIKNTAKCKYINYFWLDACWFDGAFRTGVGNYKYSEGFKNGLRKLSDTAHRNGMNFILWFEPTRAMPDTEVWKRFCYDSTKIVTSDKASWALVNIGDPEVWQYQFEHISKIIEENGVDLYRQDFNIDPYDFLKAIETPDRVGISQIRFVEGMYKLWDALKERFPGLLIDDCASGGRLIDVETTMRAFILWRSDVACRPNTMGMQNETLMLSRYIPYHQGSSFDPCPYFMRSAITTGISFEFPFLSGLVDTQVERNALNALTGDNPGLQSGIHIGEFDPEYIATTIEDTLKLREYWNGDFTALTPPSDSDSANIAYTLHVPEENKGMVLIFRRFEAPETFAIKLPDINVNENYVLEFSDENLVKTRVVVSGKELSDGYPVKIKEAPGSLVIKYRLADSI